MSVDPGVITAAAGGGLAGVLAGGLVQITLAAIKGKDADKGNVAVAQAIERLAVSQERLSVVLDAIGDRLNEQGEAIRRIEIGLAKQGRSG